MSGEATLVDHRRGVVVCERCVVAADPWHRLKGLLGRREISSEEGLLLRPAAAIHTCFMRFPIDAVFLDRSLTVLSVVPALGRWRTARRRGARAVLELKAGECERRGINPGDRLAVRWWLAVGDGPAGAGPLHLQAHEDERGTQLTTTLE
jgi:uncharacterized membrane protein (UPF0127 family)